MKFEEDPYAVVALSELDDDSRPPCLPLSAPSQRPMLYRGLQIS